MSGSKWCDKFFPLLRGTGRCDSLAEHNGPCVPEECQCGRSRLFCDGESLACLCENLDRNPAALDGGDDRRVVVDAIAQGFARALDAAEALGFKRGMETARVLAIGCHDYGGGYEGTDSRAYHHGMDTVVNVISAVLTKGHDTQTAAVMAEGRARLSEREKGQSS